MTVFAVWNKKKMSYVLISNTICWRLGNFWHLIKAVEFGLHSFGNVLSFSSNQNCAYVHAYAFIHSYSPSIYGTATAVTIDVKNIHLQIKNTF